MLNPAQQARHLQGMANMTMGAFAQENRSRVSQAREARRQAHERELARIRNERDSSEMEMLLARLAAEKEMAAEDADGVHGQDRRETETQVAKW